MNTKKSIALVSLLAVALVCSASASTRNPVQRPFQGKATVTWTINMLDGSATGLETGIASHLGLYVNVSSATWDLNRFVIVSAVGVATAANGDKVLWTMTPDTPGVVQVTGGKGRFENATGSFAALPPLEPFVSVDPETMTMTITVTYAAAGTITY